MQTVFIYSLSCPLTNAVRYIGKSVNPTKRLVWHVARRKESPSHKNSWIHGLRVLGLKPLLDIIEEVPFAEWQFWEKFYISLFKSWGFSLVNMTDGGENPPINRWNKGKKMSVESRRNMSLAQMGNKNNLGNKASVAARKNMSESHKGNQSSLGRVLSAETKRKIGDSKKGNKHCVGRIVSTATKLKMSERRIGIKLSAVTRQRMSESRRGVKKK